MGLRCTEWSPVTNSHSYCQWPEATTRLGRELQSMWVIEEKAPKKAPNQFSSLNKWRQSWLELESWVALDKEFAWGRPPSEVRATIPTQIRVSDGSTETWNPPPATLFSDPNPHGHVALFQWALSNYEKWSTAKKAHHFPLIDPRTNFNTKMGGHLFFCHSTKMASTISTSSPAKHGIAPMTISDSSAHTATPLLPSSSLAPPPPLVSQHCPPAHLVTPVSLSFAFGAVWISSFRMPNRERTFNSLTGSHTCRSLSEWPSSSLNMTLGFPYSINILSPSPSPLKY